MKPISSIIFFFLFVTFSLFIRYVDLINKPELIQNPGWHEQYKAMKNFQEWHNYMPLRANWYKQDVLNKKNSEALSYITEMGPNTVGGRVRALLIDADDSLHILAGGISGGLWSTFDGGKTWNPINEHATSLAVSCITQNPFNPKEIYYGTGEGTGNSADINGAGIFKSVDGGKSFNQLTSTSTDVVFSSIWDIEYSKTDSSTFYVGTVRNGLYRTIDKGETFQKVYNETVGIHEILTYSDSTIWFGIEGKKLMKATEKIIMSFSQFTSVLPTSGFGRMSMNYCKNFPNVAYCQVMNTSGTSLLGIYKTSDHGKNWKKLTSPPTSSYPFAWYCLSTNVSPTDTNFVLALSTKAYSSVNGGINWSEMKASHADFHTSSFYRSGKNLLIGNDGGVYHFVTKNVTSANTSLNNKLNITQFYTGNYHLLNSAVFIGGTQDNGTHYFNGVKYFSVHGGDGAYCAISPTAPFYTYVSSQNGELRRKDKDFANEINIKPSGSYWFINPFLMNPLDGNQLYVLSKNKIICSSNSGTTWENLTNNLNKTVLSIGMSHEEDPTIYFGGAGNTLYRSTKAKTTKLLEFDLTSTAPTLAKSSVINDIKVNLSDKNTIYLAMSDVSAKPKVWKLNHAESSNPEWINLSGNLPVSLPVNCIEVNPQDSNKMVVGTDFGLYSTSDGGKNWSKEMAVPNVAIFKLVTHPKNGVIYIFTHGRGIFKSQFKEFVPTAGIVQKQKDKTKITFNNPIDNQLTIHVADHSSNCFGNLKIVNSSGILIYENAFKNHSELDLSHLKQGVYILRLELDGLNYSYKVLKL